MTLDLYQIDAFTDKIFGGNPACVVPLDDWLSDEILFKITRENAVPETAFFVDKGDKIHLRWFTPEIEMDLCGHATLATAHCLKSNLNYPKDTIVFENHLAYNPGKFINQEITYWSTIHKKILRI